MFYENQKKNDNFGSYYYLIMCNIDKYILNAFKEYDIMSIIEYLIDAEDDYVDCYYDIKVKPFMIGHFDWYFNVNIFM